MGSFIINNPGTVGKACKTKQLSNGFPSWLQLDEPREPSKMSDTPENCILYTMSPAMKRETTTDHQLPVTSVEGELKIN